MSIGVGEAPGKILLVGEHAVVYGHPAIAIPFRGVKARVEVAFTRNGGRHFSAPDLNETAARAEDASPRLAPLMRLAESVMTLFHEPEQGLRVRIESSIPVGRGLGSSAAVSVALVKGLCSALDRRLDADQVCELAMEGERAFHGNPSGIDTAVAARDEPVYFVRGKAPATVAVGPSTFRFMVADTGITSPTAEVVEAVRVGREKDRAVHDSLFWELGSMASVSREIIRSGSPEELGLCMNRSHQVLQRLTVSCPELDRLVEVALENDALGAKLSGAGRGGVMIALLADGTDEHKLETELGMAGAENVYATVLASKKGGRSQ